MPSSDLVERLKAEVSDEMIHSYWEGVDHLGTKDLVVLLEMGAAIPLTVHRRSDLLAAPEVEFLTDQLDEPALQGNAVGGFWLLVIFRDGTGGGALPVRLHPMAKGGSA